MGVLAYNVLSLMVLIFYTSPKTHPSNISLSPPPKKKIINSPTTFLYSRRRSPIAGHHLSFSSWDKLLFFYYLLFWVGICLLYMWLGAEIMWENNKKICFHDILKMQLDTWKYFQKNICGNTTKHLKIFLGERNPT